MDKGFVKRKEKSCGCIVFDKGKILMIQQIKGHWSFPKGHVEDGETESETAIREVKEETNIDVKIIDEKRYTMNYLTDKGALKEVVFYIAKKIGGDARCQESEISNIMWLEPKEVLEKITYENTKSIFKKVLEDRGL